MIGIVVVSHSAMLAAGLKALADQLGSPAKLLLAAGVDDPAHPIGTDAIAVMSAMEEADDGSGVLVLMDLGSALLSAETALELLPPELSARVRLSPAPLVEGTLAAVVAAGAGLTLDEVAAEALGALGPKQGMLPASAAQATTEAAPLPTTAGCAARWWSITPTACMCAPPPGWSRHSSPLPLNSGCKRGRKRRIPAA